MRPLELKLKGLRSYHAERTIPLADESLLAIVGDTGAGKSSLLEAIVFALYAGSSWDGQRASELISDRTDTMVVELTFRAAGETWRVRRAMSRSRAGEHGLVCISNPDKPRADGALAVNREIKALVGLTREQFCSVVLLPQGRFEHLLHAPPGERVDVLKGLLGLEHAERIRDQAAELERKLSGRALEISDRRGHFLPDPHLVADSAGRQIAEIEPEVKRLSDAQDKLGEAEQHAVAKERKAEAREQQADMLEPRLAGEAAKLDALDQIERTLAQRGEPLARDLGDVEEKFQQSGERVEAARQERRDRQTLERGIEVLEDSHSRLERLDSDQVALGKRCAEADQLGTKLAEAETNLPALEARLDEATAAAEEASSHACEEEERYQQLDEAIRELGSKLDEREAAEQSVADNQDQIDSASALEERRRGELDAAIGAREQAERERDRLVALAPVVALAQDCNAGDPCPVCERALPDDFESPEVDGLGQAQAAHAQTQEAERNAQVAHAQATAELKQLRDRLPALERVRDETGTGLGEAEAALQALTEQLDGFRRMDLLERGREQAVLAEHELDKLLGDVRTKTTAREEHEDERNTLANGLDSDKQLLESKERDNEREQKRITEDRDQVVERTKKLRLPQELPNALATVSLADALTELAELLPVAKQLEEEHNQLLDRKQQLSQALDELDKELRREVREPGIIARAALASLRQELERLSVRDLPQPPDVSATTGALAAWGKTIEQAAADELEKLRSQAKELRHGADAAREAALSHLRELGIESREELDTSHAALLADLRIAQRDLAQAEAQIEPVATLDDLRKRTETMRAACADLYHLLLDGNFVKYAVANRQRVLLAAASLVLKELTGGHYGFSEDFRIVDNETRQPRAPRTLSGGESFLASLSLALGLVEATARTGGRLDALFLDEGFGSLDPNALQQSLDALERRAEAGRLVAVISHVPLVAEQIERVLQVTRDHEGSNVRLMTASERAELAFADAAEVAL